jgi:hypothetical protein
MKGVPEQPKSKEDGYGKNKMEAISHAIQARKEYPLTQKSTLSSAMSGNRSKLASRTPLSISEPCSTDMQGGSMQSKSKAYSYNSKKKAEEFSNAIDPRKTNQLMLTQ